MKVIEEGTEHLYDESQIEAFRKERKEIAMFVLAGMYAHPNDPFPNQLQKVAEALLIADTLLDVLEPQAVPEEPPIPEVPIGP